jgi:Cu(I)/Ag(I) efflux system membrane fusion protein
MNKPTTNKTVLAVSCLLVLALGATLGFVSRPWLALNDMQHAPMAPAADNEAQVLYWYDPMYPQQQFDEPGRSPFMDMDLVPRYAGASSSQAGATTTVFIDPAIQQNLGMRVVAVTTSTLSATAEFTGNLALNERDQSIVQTRADAFVEQAAALADGDLIKQGDLLAELLVPDWVAGQHELLLLKNSLGNDADMSLVAAARERLRLLGMPPALVAEVERTNTVKTTYAVRAPHDGVIQALGVRPGMRLDAGQTLAQIYGLDTVWLDVWVPEAQSQLLTLGSAASAHLVAFPGRIFDATVAEILPVLGDSTRNLRARFQLDNTDGLLRPGMSARVTLALTAARDTLVIPTEALIRTGTQTRVMVAEGDGRFRTQAVRIGNEIADQTQILAGLQEGDQVVVSGQFLLDSEARLQGVAVVAVDAAGVNAAGMAADNSADADVIEMILHEADGRIVALGDGEVRLAHGAFPTLPMPGMTMTFPLANDSVTQGLAVGDNVRIGLSQTDAGVLIERLQKLDDAGVTEVQP